VFPAKPANTATRGAVLKPPVQSVVKGNTVQAAWQVIFANNAPKVLCKVIQDRLLVPSVAPANSLMLMEKCRANYVCPIHITATKEETAAALVVQLVGMLFQVVLGVNLVWLAKPASLVKIARRESIVAMQIEIFPNALIVKWANIHPKWANPFVWIAMLVHMPREKVHMCAKTVQRGSIKVKNAPSRVRAAKMVYCPTMIY
jgi:hypothetical protein